MMAPLNGDNDDNLNGCVQVQVYLHLNKVFDVLLLM